MTVREILLEGTALLKSPSTSAFIDTPSLDASLLLAEILKVRREELILRENQTSSEQTREKFLRLVDRRRSGECVAYILGRKEFRGLEFTINRNVLVPRPDTETLFEAALEYIDSMTEESLSVLDLCTGSGALAVSLKKERPLLSVSASDISQEALDTAALNAERLLEGATASQAISFAANKTVNFIHSNLFENISGKFKIIISNPPYVPSGELEKLTPEVRNEPKLALDGGEDGLVLIKEIISKIPDHLAHNGILLLEAGTEQMPTIRHLFESNNFNGIKFHKDLRGKERVISGKYKPV